MRKIYLGLLTLLIIFFSSLTLNAQLTGTKNIPGDYADLAAAITDLNTQGVGAGGVTINLVAGNPQTAPVGGYIIGGIGSLVLATSSAANPIIIQGNGNTITASAALTVGILNDAIFKVVGADWVTLSGFSMLENAANTTVAAAANNMTEWGVAILYATTIDGCQNVTIQNNTIDLNRTYQNTFGIYSNSTHAYNSQGSSATATGAAGGNNGLKLYGNSITDVNMGIVVVGPTAAADQNDGLEIGGSAPNANTITNFGTTGTFSIFANVSATVCGILVRNTKNFNISYNSITSSNGGTTAGTLRTIYITSFSSAPTGTFSNSINNNNISATTGLASGGVFGVTVETTTGNATSSISISNNNFHNSGHNVASPTGAVTFISDAMANLNTTISNNTFTNLTISSTGSVTFINQPYTVPASGTQTISNNSIVTGFTKPGGGGIVTLIQTSGSTVAADALITHANNNFSNITVTGATAINGFISTDGLAATATPRIITGNTFSNWTGGTSNINVISYSYMGSTTSTVSSNTISNLTSQSNIIAISLTASGNNGNPLTVSSNTISGLSSTGTGGNVTGINITNTSPVININNNSINTFSSTGQTATIAGIAVTAATVTNIFSNTIHTFSGSGLSTPVANGISVSGGATVNVYKNKIYNISEIGQVGSTAPLVNGILLSGGGATGGINVYNNLVGDLTTPASTSFDAIRGISVTAATATANYNLSYNTIYINASSFATHFGTTGIYHTTSATATTARLTLRNNIIINKSVPNGAGLTVAYRRSSSSLANYNSTSNNNLFYAGTPGISNFIYSDGVSNISDLISYKSFISSIPADQNSETEDVAFQSLTGSSADFLKYNNTIVTKVESGAENVTGITDDFAGTIRQGNAGYLGTAPKPDMGAWELDGLQPSCSGTPGASNSITSLSPACLGQNVTMSLSQTYVGVSYQWQSSTDNVTYTDIPGAIGTTYLVAASVSTWYQCIITCSGNSTTSTPVQVVVNPPLIGTYTINNLAATAGTNFNNFVDAITALNCRGVGGAVIFDVSAGQIFNEAGNLSINIEGTVTNTITFQKSGVGANPKIIRSGTTGLSDYVLRLNGADYYTFDGIDFEQSGVSATDWVEFGVFLTNANATNGAKNNTIKNGVVSLSGSNSNTRCIYVAATTTPTAVSGTNSNNRFLNMTVQNSFYGYRIGGSTNTYPDNGNEIGTEGGGVSLIQNLGNGAIAADIYGVFAAYQTGFKVSNTTVNNLNNSGAGFSCGLNAQSATANNVEFSNNIVSNIVGGGTTYGIQISSGAVGNIFNNTVHTISTIGSTNIVRGIIVSASAVTANIYGNKIYNISSTGITTTTAAGIEVGTGDVFNIYNNMISDVRASASTSTSGGTRGITTTGSTLGQVVRVYYNSVSLSDIGSIPAYTSAGFYNSSATPIIDFRNNIIVNKSISASGRIVAYWKSSTAVNQHAGTNNNLYYAGAPGPNNLVYYDGTNAAQNMFEIQTFAGVAPREALSVLENVQFLPVVNGILRPFAAVSTLVESGGQEIGGYTTDFENTARGSYPLAGQANGGGTSPDIGADEGDFTYIMPVLPSCVLLNEPVNTTNDICASNNLTLKWSPAATGGLVSLGYDIYLGTSATPPFLANTNNLSYPVTGLLPNTTYYWKVVPKNLAGSATGCPTSTFTTINVGIASTVPGSRCGEGTVNLSATGNGTINWYSSATGGFPIHSGSNYTTPVLNSNTTYYAGASVFGGSTQTANHGSPTSTTSTQNMGLLFDLNVDVLLNSVDVYTTTGSGSIVVSLYNNAGVLMYSAPFTVTTGTLTTPQTLNLDWPILAGIGYRILMTTHTPNLGFHNATFPIPLGNGVGNITSGASATATSTTHYFFYNMKTTTGCSSPRVPVVATVNTPPAISASATIPTICAGTPTQLNVTSTNAGYSYVWNPGSLAGASPTVSPTTSTTYTVTASDNSGGANDGCANSATVSVTVNPIPTPVVITPGSSSFCTGASTQLLTANGGMDAKQMNFGTQAFQNTATTLAAGYPAPYTVYFGGQRMQMLMTAAELTAAGFTAGTQLKEIQFPVVSLGSNWGGSLSACQNFQMSIGHTALTSISAFQTGLTQVIAPADFSPLVGYTNTHTFSTPFVWDGTSNLIFETTFSNAITGGANDLVVQHNSPTPFQSTIVYRVDGVAAATVATTTTVSYSYNSRPDFKLYGLNPTSITWSPLTNLYTDGAATIPYTGGPATSVYALPITNQTYTATATNSYPCSVSGTATVTINPPPTATISYDASPYCSNAGTASVTRTGYAAGSYTSTAGLSINGGTGAVNLGASTPGTYTVTYTIPAANGCPQVQTTTSITIQAPPSATISYPGSPYCSGGGTATVTLTGTLGGTYSSTPGLSINSTTGEIDLAASTVGTYTVTYTIAAGACAQYQATASVTITNSPTATISYAGSPYCSNGTTATVTQTGSDGGTYTSTTGLTIDPATGAVNIATSTPGTYTVTYTIAAASGCSAFQTTTSITINQLPSAPISYAGSPYCSNAGTATVTHTGTSGGIYSSTPGLSINSSTGAINLGASTGGTYTVTYTVPAGSGCPQVPTTTSVTVTSVPSAIISYAGSPYCATAGTANVSRTGTAGGTYTAPAGLSIDASTGAVNPGTSTPGTHTVTYTVAAAGGCAQYQATTNITINAAPSATISYAGSPYCSNGGTATVTHTGTTGGAYSSTAGLSINASTGAINLGASTPGTYTVTYTIAAGGGCTQVQTTASVTITAAPTATISYAGSPYCGNAGIASVTHTGATGGTYSSTTGLTINSTTGEVNLVTSTPGTYTVTYTVAAANGCAQLQVTTPITITAAPTATISYVGSPYCSNTGTANVTHTGTTGGTYSSTAGLSINATTGAVNLATSTPGAYTVTYTIAAANGCSQVQATASITITAAPTATISYAGSPFCVTAGTINVTRTGTPDGTYTSTTGLSINAATGAINTVTSTPGTYTITYTVAAGGGCAQFQTTTSVTIVSSGTWLGVVSTDWNTAGNWCGGIPTSTTDVIIPSTAPNMPNLSGANGSVRNMAINNGATVTIGTGGILDLYGNISGAGTFNATSGNISFRGANPQTIPGFTAVNVTMNGAGGVMPGGNSIITGTLLLTNGHITLGNNNLSLSNTSTGSAASHIITNGTGNVILTNLAATQARTVPVGSDATSYNPATIAANAGHTTDNISVRVQAGVFENGVSGNTFTTHVANRTWIINEGTPAGSNVNVTLQWAGSQELPSFDRAKCYVMQHNGTTWSQSPPSAAPGTDPYTQTKQNVTSFSPFAVQTQPIPRPETGIYPNPVTSFMYVVTDLLSDGPVEFQVFDAKGSMVYRRKETMLAGLNQTRLELGHLSQGVYVIRVVTRLNNEFLVQRFIKVH